ncbi:MAG TPA: TIGR03560 family F420-dependent LLM class oxidoreductase [bacterium]|nr:TIGR03560 family F420-dependent LLM class oxidoreductase [bacterium]
MIRVGVMVEGQEGLTWDRWRRIAETAEAAGFESLWRSDHLFSLFGVETRPGLDAWTSLAALATMTRRLRFGPLVSPITFYHPAVLARHAAAVDVLSGGRLELGIGAGWHDREHEAFGVPYPRVGERIRRLDEAAHVIRALWGDGPARFDGRYYRLAGAVGWPKPTQRPAPPLVIGGKGPRLLEVVAKHADEWNCGGSQPPAAVRARRAILETACRAMGRDPTAIRYSWMGAFIIGESRAALDARARKIQEYVITRAGESPHQLPETLRSTGWLVGTPGEIVEQVAALAAEGIERVMLQYFDQEDLDALRLIGEQVIPRLRNVTATRPPLS